MFEQLNTEEIILKRMLNKVPKGIDKREGSIIYNTLAPVALELAIAYSNLDRYLEYTFANPNTPEEYLEKRVMEIGMTRKQATKSIKKGIFYDNKNVPFDIPLKTRFSIDNLNYMAIEKIQSGVYKMECEQLGAVGNVSAGTLIPIDYVEGLSRAELTEIIEEGQDIEPGEELYFRFAEKERNPTTSGNVNHYKEWALEVTGVGKVKVFPLWNKEGTVKVVIVDSDKKSPSTALVNKVLEHINSIRPIGATVTVSGAIEKQINIFSKVKLVKGFSIQQVQQGFIDQVNSHLKDIGFEVSYISIARIGNLLLSTPGVLDYTDLKLNNNTSNIELENEEIPVASILLEEY